MKVGWSILGPIANLPKEKLTSIQFSSMFSSMSCEWVQEFQTRQSKIICTDYGTSTHISIREKDLVHEAFEKNVCFEDGRYSVPLPWKEHHQLLPDTFENSVARLSSQLRRLRKDPKILEYDTEIREKLKRVDTTKGSQVGKVHYLPYRAVICKEALATKLRVMFDASSKATRDTPSLNECLYTGPALTPMIFDILLRFREWKFAF